MADKILLIEDDLALAKALDMILRQANYVPGVAHTAEDGVRLALSEQFDLVLLDVMVPQMGGWEVCRLLREALDIPIIFLTAMGSVENVVYGLEMGADDYLVKPVDQAELLARIKAHLRRMEKLNPSSQKLSFGGQALVLDVAARLVWAEGEAVELTRREYDLLVTLAMNAGRVVTTADLARLAWGMHDMGAEDNAKTYVHYLRKKIERDPANPRWIHTVRGVGYRFAEE
ncbi:MAG: response regulator transcription factor [Ardenticatenaceae bacterium]|nr:response regulator transcription factor [Ardenticatenaceae bacterium]